MNWSEDKYGYIDKTGKFIIPLTKNFYTVKIFTFIHLEKTLQ